MQSENEWQSAAAYSKFVFVMYSLFMAGYFFFPQAPEHYKFYYYFVLIPSFGLWPDVIRSLRGNTLFLLLMSYILYMVASSFWSPEFEWGAFMEVAWHGFLVASFIVITAALRDRFPANYDRMLRLLVFVAAVAGVVSIVLWYGNHPFPVSRMKPAGRMEWEIRAAGVYGFFWLLSLHFFLESRERIRWGYLLAGLPLFLTVMFTQTRTALIAMAVAGLVLSLRRNYRAVLGFGILAASMFLLFPDLWRRIMRGMAHRVPIWAAAFDQAKEHWMFGNGYLCDTSVIAGGENFLHAHDMYIATFRDGGVIGLGLLTAAIAVAVLWSVYLNRCCRYVLYPALLIYLFLYSIPNPDRLFTRPREQWLFIWLPLILVMADYARCRQGNRAPLPAPRPVMVSGEASG
ncbi:MAG TPA: O-antigen ligase domain-containing protein [Gammaproteobacteria bacterium]|nr:O-antigen ligase domain-containing protein [Gammaproteobacteria bacterium]